MSEKDFGVPQAPEIKEKWIFKNVQKFGVPLLMLIPLLALFGLFGESFETVRADGEALSVEVRYPTRLRYKMTNPLTVSVENISSQTVPTVTVKVSEDYISAFTAVTFRPSVAVITPDAYYVQLSNLQAGETRRVVVDLQAERYWSHEGSIGVAAGSLAAPSDIELDVGTFVFP